MAMYEFESLAELALHFRSRQLNERNKGSTATRKSDQMKHDACALAFGEAALIVENSAIVPMPMQQTPEWNGVRA